MVLDVILGVNIDTEVWFKELLVKGCNNIAVIDYDFDGEPEIREGLLYISSLDAKAYFREFHAVNFYKSMYVYPGMNGKMSNL